MMVKRLDKELLKFYPISKEFLIEILLNHLDMSRREEKEVS